MRRPGPVAIDPISGFKIPWRDLVRQWDGEMVARQYADKRNPQDFVRARPERIALPYARPEPEPIGIALGILWEDGTTPIMAEDGPTIWTEGVVPTL